MPRGYYAALVRGGAPAARTGRPAHVERPARGHARGTRRPCRAVAKTGPIAKCSPHEAFLTWSSAGQEQTEDPPAGRRQDMKALIAIAAASLFALAACGGSPTAAGASGGTVNASLADTMKITL